MAVSITKAKKKKKKPTSKVVARKNLSSQELFSKFHKLHALGSVKLGEIDQMLIQGEPVSKVLLAIKKWGGLGIKESGLRQYIYRYKWEVIELGKSLADIYTEVQEEIARNKIKEEHCQELVEDIRTSPFATEEDKEQAEEINKLAHANQIRKIAHSYNVLDELCWLVGVQKGRIAKLHNREKELPTLLSQLGGEIRTMQGLLKDLGEQQFELGIVARMPKVKVLSDERGMTYIESVGKDVVNVSIANHSYLADAVDSFYKVLNTNPKLVGVE